MTRVGLDSAVKNSNNISNSTKVLICCQINIIDLNGNKRNTIKLPINKSIIREYSTDNNHKLYGIDFLGIDGNQKLMFSKGVSAEYLEFDCGISGIKPFKIVSGIEVVALNTINKILTSDVSNKGFSYENNKRLLLSYLRVLNNGISNKDIKMDDINRSMKYVFSKEFDWDDRRDDKDKRKFSGIYKVGFSNYYDYDARKVNKSNKKIIISSDVVREGELIGMALLDRFYISSKVCNQLDKNYHEKYNEFLKKMKSESKQNIRYILDILDTRCLYYAYRDEENFIEEVIG